MDMNSLVSPFRFSYLSYLSFPQKSWDMHKDLVLRFMRSSSYSRIYLFYFYFLRTVSTIVSATSLHLTHLNTILPSQQCHFPVNPQFCSLHIYPISVHSRVVLSLQDPLYLKKPTQSPHAFLHPYGWAVYSTYHEPHPWPYSYCLPVHKSCAG